MTDLASFTPRLPFFDGRRLGRFGGDWTMADWIVGSLSVALALGSAGFFAVSYMISVRSPDYFQNAVLAGLPPKLDPIQTGSVDVAGAMPAPEIVRLREPQASDYQIVMVFRDEALLATRDELVRVKVGSVVPGLGTIRAIAGSSASGGTVTADKATLRSAQQSPQ